MTWVQYPIYIFHTADFLNGFLNKIMSFFHEYTLSEVDKMTDKKLCFKSSRWTEIKIEKFEVK